MAFAQSLALGVLFSIAALEASNHREAPIAGLGKPGGQAELIAMATYSAGRAALVLCLDPLLAVAKTASFDPAAAYELRVDNNGDTREDVTFRVRFLPGGARYRVDLVRGGAVAELSAATAVGRPEPAARGVKAFAGLVADPASVMPAKIQPAAEGVAVVVLDVPVDLIAKAGTPLTGAAVEASISVSGVAVRTQSISAVRSRAK